MRPSLTVGMAVYQDFSGVYFTILALKIYHPHVEFIVVDNAPQPSRQTEGITLAVGGTYIHRPDLVGTSRPRAHVFEQAKTDWVCCVDCHVLLEPGAIEALLAYAEANPDSRDIISGPMMADNGERFASHWQADPTCGLWGVWGHDPRIDNPTGPAFEIPMMGLGCFAMRKATWPGFNDHFQGFGGEEGYLHEKIRQRGGKAICLPALGWYHRFRDVGGGFEGVPYPLRLEDHTWNLLIGHRELGIEATEKIYNHFGKRLTLGVWQGLVRTAEEVQPFGSWLATNSPLEQAYRDRCNTPTVINQHLPTLRHLASEANEVVEFGVDAANSTIALLAGKPKIMRCYDVGDSVRGREAGALADGTRWSFEVVSDLAIPPQPCDLLWIDTHHTAEHLQKELDLHAPACRRRIAMHDTEVFGDVGEDGRAGLREGIRWFLQKNPDWHCMAHYPYNSGLTILSRDPTDPRAYPDWLGKLNPTLKVLGIWYTNNKAPLKLMQASLKSIDRAQRLSRHDVRIGMCVWEPIEGWTEKFPWTMAIDKNGNHLTITRQMVLALCAASGQPMPWSTDEWEKQSKVLDVHMQEFDCVCFLEHDTLYPDDYFDRVADAFLANPTAPVVSNLDYEGLNATGFLDVKERHEPMHQLSLRREYALTNLERCLKHFEAGTPDTLLEPDSGPRGDRSAWVRLPPDGRKPSLHVNFAGRFTSHGEVVYHQHSFNKKEHHYWGKREDLWDGPVDDSPAPEQKPRVPDEGQRGCPGCPKGRYHFKTVDSMEMYNAKRLSSENIAEHMPTLLRMAFECEHVTSLSCWHDGAFIALAAGLPKTLWAACPNGQPEWQILHEQRMSPAPQTFTSFPGDPIVAPVEETDMIFVSARHNATYIKMLLDRHGNKAKKWIAFHNTVTYGENSDGGADERGLLAGIREWLRENPQWSVKSHARNNNGLLVLTRLAEEKKELPPKWQQAWNVLKASWKAGESVLDKYGPLVGTPVQEGRLALCTLCPSRTNGDCAECGCPVDMKTSWPEQECPLGAWQVHQMEVVANASS